MRLSRLALRRHRTLRAQYPAWKRTCARAVRSTGRSPSAELGGLVWACLDPKADEPTPRDLPPDATRYDSFVLTDRVTCGVVEAAEYFLDGFHTHFVHAGLIRRPVQRRRVTVVTSEIPNGVMASYRGEGVQSGLISRLFERDGSESMGRFTLPGTAEVEYRGAGNRLTLLATTWLTPETNGSLPHLRAGRYASGNGTGRAQSTHPGLQIFSHRVPPRQTNPGTDQCERRTLSRRVTAR